MVHFVDKLNISYDNSKPTESWRRKAKGAKISIDYASQLPNTTDTTVYWRPHLL